MKIKCPECNVHKNHFNEVDFLICTNCGLSFHKRSKIFVITDKEKSYYGRMYDKRLIRNR